jgi:hypothetical protein
VIVVGGALTEERPMRWTAPGNMDASHSLLSMKGRNEMSWIVLICLIVLVVAAAADAGLDWTDFLPW